MPAVGRDKGPWGGVVLRTVRARLEKGWPPGLTVLTGDDLYHLDRAQEAILAQLVPDPHDSFAWSIVGEGALSTGSLVGSARSTGMFASRRVVFVRDIAGLEGKPEPLVEYGQAPPSQSYLLVRAPKLDQRRVLHKALVESGLTFRFDPPGSDPAIRELMSEVSALAGARGVKLDARAASLLIEVCNLDLNRVVSELDKLATWQGTSKAGSPPIDAAVLRDLVAGSGVLTGWEVADGVTERDAGTALAAARRLLDSGDEPIKMIGGLASRARALLKAKAMTEGKASLDDAVRASRAWFWRDRLATGLKRYTRPELLAMPGALLLVDRSLKSRGLDKGAMVESLVTKTTHASGAKR